MSLDGQGSRAAGWPAGGTGDPGDCAEDCGPGSSQPAVVVATFAMAAGSRFEWHTHHDHQLAWAPSGVLTVVTDAATWVLPPTRALWIPAELAHETLASSGRATLRSLYVRPDLCPISWPEPRPVVATPLLAELITYLESAALDGQRRGRVEALLLDLLEGFLGEEVQSQSLAALSVGGDRRVVEAELTSTRLKLDPVSGARAELRP